MSPTPSSDLSPPPGALAPAGGDKSRAEYALWLGDDALVLAQRMGEWIAAAPELEEDLALANIGLDLLGQARALLAYAGSASGRTEDDLAYLREAADYRNVVLVERSDSGDFAHCIARLLVFSSYQLELYARLVSSADETLAAVAAKAVKEVAYHRDHAAQWTLRLGDGTDESHRRMQAALADVWPYVAELFASDALIERLEGTAVDPCELREPALGYVAHVVERATLTMPTADSAAGGGRTGRHSDALASMLAEMQVLARAMPGVTW